MISIDRNETAWPPCVHAEHCGGCLYQGGSYGEQLAVKLSEVQALLEQNGLPRTLAKEVRPSPVRYRYRNKMEFTFGNETKGAPIVLGLHRRKSFMSIVSAESCQISPEEFNEVVRQVLAFVKERGYSFYHKRRHEGLLRTLVLRKGIRTGELLVNIVTTSQEAFDRPAFLECLLALPLADRIAGVMHTVNDRRADAVLCDAQDLLYGRPYYRERLMDLDFHVGPFSFFQTNVEAVDRMFNEALALVPSIADKTVWDLYSGTGTLALAMAKTAKEVIGVEIVGESVAMAKQSAERNGIANVRFYEGDVLHVLESALSGPDVIVVDPPRAGLHAKALRRILDAGAPHILYISCNPATQLRDVSVAREAGYSLTRFQSYDNFPFTRHIEAVALLARRGEESGGDRILLNSP